MKRILFVVFTIVVIFTLMLSCTMNTNAQNNNSNMEQNTEFEKVTPEEVKAFLDECGMFFLATTEGDQPHVRPFSATNIFEGRIYFLTGREKNVFKQIEKNGKFEVFALNQKKGGFLRITGRLVNDDRVEAKKSMLERNPYWSKTYSAENKNTIVMYIDDATAVWQTADGTRNVRF